MPGNFGGHWNFGGTALVAGSFADLQQNGASIVGTYFNNGSDGVISGFIDGDTLAGQWRVGPSTGTFIWSLTSNHQQFQGTWNDTNDWCGWRNGSSQPFPCKPGLIHRIPIDLQDKVFKITLVAPLP
jgi:hypothetical protein